MAGTSPAMTVGAADVTHFIYRGRPKAGAELANDDVPDSFILLQTKRKFRLRNENVSPVCL